MQKNTSYYLDKRAEHNFLNQSQSIFSGINARASPYQFQSQIMESFFFMKPVFQVPQHSLGCDHAWSWVNCNKPGSIETFASRELLYRNIDGFLQCFCSRMCKSLSITIMSIQFSERIPLMSYDLFYLDINNIRWQIWTFESIQCNQLLL